MDRKTLISLLILLAPVLVFFGPALYRGESFAYRDSGRFYYRQFEWNRTQWLKGEVPLWNSQENLGEPVIAEASSSVFYPLQLILLVSGITFARLFVLYAAVHVYLAGVGCFFLARHLGCRVTAALFGAIGYCLSGALVFQTCNIVFLVGGCWLPFAVWQSCRLFRNPGHYASCWLGIFLALMTLGGDPQMAYHVIIVAAIFGAWQYWKPSIQRSSLSKVFVYHLASVCLALSVSAVQILPSWQASRESTRAYSVHARSIWELMQGKYENATEGLFGHPPPYTHQDHIYQFSQTPWSFSELVWPNVSGKIDANSRWVESLPGASRTWTPSIYCGILTFTMFLSGFIRRSRSVQQRWLKSCCLLFAIGSLGWYGIGWLSHELGNAFFDWEPASSKVGAPVGGIYWFMVVVLPGYVNFRYPAKLFLVATLFICLIAAREVESIKRRRQIVRFKNFLIGILGVSACVLFTVWCCSIPLNHWIDQLARNVSTEFGPLQSDNSWSSIILGLISGIGFCFAGIMLVNQFPRKETILVGLLFLTLIDLSLANRCLVVTARSSLWDRSQKIAEKFPSDRHGLVRIFRTDPMVWSTRNSWLARPEKNRLEQIVDFEVQTIMSRHHLAVQANENRIGLVESFRSLEDTRFATWMAFLKSGKGIRTNDSYDVQLAPNPSLLGWMSCEYLLIPAWGKPELKETGKSGLLKSWEALCIRNPGFQPRFRFAKKVKTLDPVEDLTRWLAVEENRKQIVDWIGETGENGRVDGEFLETNGEINLEMDQKTGARRDISLLSESETQVELKVTGSGVLIMADKFDPDWHAFRIAEDGSETEIPILRANFVMRAIPLASNSEGHDRIRLIYRPRSVKLGAWISGITLLLLVFGMTVSSVYLTYRRRNQER